MSIKEGFKRIYKKTIKIIRRGSYSWVFAFLIILITSQMCLNLGMDLSKTPCEFHACKYKDILLPGLAILTGIFFLPILIAYVFFHTSHLILIFITMGYWVILAYLFQKLYLFIKGKYYKFKKITPTKIIDEDELQNRMITDMGFFYILIVFLISSINAFFYYPKYAVNVQFDDYILIASLLVIILTLYFTIKKEKLDEHPVKIILAISLLSLFFFLYGAFYSLSLTSQITPETNIDNLASMSAFQTGTFTAGFVGIMYVFSLIFMSFYPTKKKTKIKDEDYYF
jgi:hypothetical protein